MNYRETTLSKIKVSHRTNTTCAPLDIEAEKVDLTEKRMWLCLPEAGNVGKDQGWLSSEGCSEMED